MSRKAITLILTLVSVLAISAIAVAFITNTPTGPKTTDTPRTAATDCHSGNDLQQQINDASKGTTLKLSGTYCLAQRIDITGKQGLVLDGSNQTVLRQMPQHTDKLFVVDQSSDIVFRRLEIAGSSPSAGNRPGAYKPDTAGASAIAVKGSDGVVVQETFIHDIYGDFIDLDRGPDKTVTRNVEIANNRFERNGRQAISLGVFAEEVVIAGNSFLDMRRSVFDLEPSLEEALIKGIEIRDNDIDNFRNYVVAIGPKGVIQDVRVQGNRIRAKGGDNGGLGMLHVPYRGPNTPPVTGLVVCENTGDLVDKNNYEGATDPMTSCDGG